MEESAANRTLFGVTSHPLEKTQMRLGLGNGEFELCNDTVLRSSFRVPIDKVGQSLPEMPLPEPSEQG